MRSIKVSLQDLRSLEFSYLERVLSTAIDEQTLFVGMTLLSLVLPGAAVAQKKIPKAAGHNQCPLGYVNTLGTTCVSPIAYEVQPSEGNACPSGWMNIGAGYCRKK